MTELIFPMTMTLIVYAVFVPMLTLLSRLALELRAESHPHEAGHWSVFALIVAPLVLPTAAILGAALHRIDGHHAYEVCVAIHHSAESCDEAVLLALLVGLPLLASLVWRLRRARRRGVRSLRHEALYGVEVRVVSGWDVCTRGLFNPWIEVGEQAEKALSPTQLEAAILHEAEHARARDPLVSLLGRAALSVNPLGFLLRPWFHRWQLGREIRCDLKAVELGGDRFALAESLVAVARSTGGNQLGVSYLTGAAASLRLRVHVLVANRIPTVRSDHTILAVVVGASAIVALGLGYLEMPWIDRIHFLCERFFNGWFS